MTYTVRTTETESFNERTGRINHKVWYVVEQAGTYNEHSRWQRKWEAQNIADELNAGRLK